MRAVRVVAGSVVGDALVVSARGSRPQVVSRATPPVGLVQVVSVSVWLLPFVRPVTVMAARGGVGVGDAG